MKMFCFLSDFSIVRFYELAEGRHDRHTWRHATWIESTVFEALEKLKYEYLELLIKAPTWATEDGDCAPIAGVLAQGMAKALSENRINDANLLAAFTQKLREFNQTEEDGIIRINDYSFLEEDEDAVERITSAISKREILEAIELLKEAYELGQYNLLQFLELEPKEKMGFLEQVRSIAASGTALHLLADAYEVVTEAEVRSMIESARQCVARKLYLRFADKQSDLLEQLKSTDQVERWKAAYILGDFGGSETIEALEALLNCETDFTIRQIAGVSLEKIKRRLVTELNDSTTVWQKGDVKQIDMRLL